MLRRNADQWQAGGCKYAIHKINAPLAVRSLMALVIQFNTGQWAHGLWITQQEIHTCLRSILLENGAGNSGS